MSNNYKIIVSGKDLYTEFSFSDEQSEIKLGTQAGCNFRLDKEQFFETIRIGLVLGSSGWSAICAENLFLSIGDSRRMMALPVKHGDRISVGYRSSGSEAFTFEFLIDFDSEIKKYERKIHISNLSSIKIGTSPDCQICLSGDYAKNDLIGIRKTKESYTMTVFRSSYGVTVNGAKASDGCTVHNTDFFAVADYGFYLKDDCLWTQIRDDLQINGLSFEDCLQPLEYPKFKRNTRLKKAINRDAVEMLDPPSRPQKTKSNLLTSLLSAVSMLLVSGAMAIMGGSSMMAFSMISGVLAIITIIVGFVQSKVENRKELRHRLETYHTYADNKHFELTALRKDEKELLEEIYLDQQTEKSLLDDFSGDLFDRRPEDDDFLHVRLGKGTIKSFRQVEYKKQERLEIEDDLQLIPEKISKEFENVVDAPVILDMRNCNAIGIVGEEQRRFSILKNIVFDLCIRQYQSDIRLFFVAEESNKDRISWTRFLPHAMNEATGGRNLAYDSESKNRLFDYLYKELCYREQNKDNPQFTRFVVFFYDECGVHTHPISKFIHRLKELSMTFVFMAERKEHIPQGCTAEIVLTSDTEGSLVQAENCVDSIKFIFDSLPDAELRHAVEQLAPIYTEEISLEGSLTKNISLFELLDIYAVDDLDLGQRWSASKVFESMAAPIGVTKSNMISLDLHDKAHGPHGLVAGTTGSGKSEILQTYILSIATLFHPFEVSFVIIDFKGGGMVNQFRNLPHLVGAITNIDGKQIDRSLKSIKAELRKRQQLFAEAGVNHIDKYIQKFKAGEVTVPVPHLVLIVDEFAELKAEQPDFMKELISAARIGRSLGVHLILATQKPSGQVDDQIWSNSKFRLCLKVQSPEDSNEVLKSPLAAEIKEPGRAYLQVGNNEIFELFQSAYSGAPEKMTDSKVREFSLYSVSASGKRTPIFVQKKRKNGAGSQTQLEAIVNYVKGYCDSNRITRLPDICLPALPNLLDYPANSNKMAGMVGLGLYDDPDNQIQQEACIDIRNHNTVILGSSQYGKTNLLQVMIRSIVRSSSAAEASIYILDFGSMILKNFESLNQVGGVVCAAEDEKLKNLFKLLFAEISDRKEHLLACGVSSFSSYLEAGYKDLPQIYILIDNLGALMELYLNDDDSLLSILRDGLSVGISVIATNSQTNGIGYRYLSNFANKIAFHCNDSSEYANLFDSFSLHPDAISGRCILEINRKMFECQTYLAFCGEKEIDRVQQIQEFISKTNSRYPKLKTKKIPCIPQVLSRQVLEEEYSAVSCGFRVPVGITYNGVEPFSIDLSQLGLFGLCGKEGTGHRNFLRILFHALENNDVKTQVVIFDDVSRKLEEFRSSPLVTKYSLNTEPVNDILSQWHAVASERYEQMSEGDVDISQAPLLLMLIQNNDIAKCISDEFSMMEQFSEITTKFKDMRVAFVFTNCPNVSLSYDAPEPLRMLKQSQHLLCFEDLDNLKLIDVDFDILKANTKRLQSGDAYYMKDNDVTKLKLVLFDNPE